MKYFLFLLLALISTISFSQEVPEEKPLKPVEGTPREEIYDLTEVKAEFPSDNKNGAKALEAYIFKNINYPQIAIDNNDQGNVYLQFVIEKDGSIRDIVVLLGVSKELDNEAKRLVRNMPKWIPAEVYGKKVVSRYVLPIRFKLN